MVLKICIIIAIRIVKRFIWSYKFQHNREKQKWLIGKYSFLSNFCRNDNFTQKQVAPMAPDKMNFCNEVSEGIHKSSIK